MTTKDYLKQIRWIDNRINNKMAEIEAYKQMMYGLKAITNGDKVQTSPNPDKIGNSVAKLIDMESKLDSLVLKYVSKKEVIVDQIDNIGNEYYYSILFARYVENKRFSLIADEMALSERRVYGLHDEALEKFEKLYGETYLA